MEEMKIPRIAYRPHPDPRRAQAGEKVKALSLDYKVVKEDWNIYELEDGARMKARLIVTRVDKPLDVATSEVIYAPDGTPSYGAELRVETVFECPEELLKREGKQ